MRDLTSPFKGVDECEMPDLWEEILSRQPEMEAQPIYRRYPLAAIVVASALSVGAVAFLVFAFQGVSPEGVSDNVPAAGSSVETPSETVTPTVDDSPSPAAETGFSVVRFCPGDGSLLPVDSSMASLAEDAAHAFLFGPEAEEYVDQAGLLNGLQPGGGEAPNRVISSEVAAGDPLIRRACGDTIANHAMAVLVDDGSESASLDFYLYLVRRVEGWRVWAAY